MTEGETGMTNKKDSGDPRQARTGAAGMTSNTARGESPGNLQSILIKKTLIIRIHYPRHNISLPLSLLVKGIRGKVWMGNGD
jgi:hypothetical protein